jgi:signal transduction histidine kinase
MVEQNRRRFQLLVSFSVLALLTAGTFSSLFISRRLISEMMVEQVIEDNRVIGREILEILSILDYEQMDREALINKLQNVSDRVMLPNEGFMCAAGPKGTLVAFPGFEQGEDMSFEDAEFLPINEDSSFSYEAIPEDKTFEGFYQNETAGEDDVIVAMPVGDTDLRLFIHQSREGIMKRARQITRPVFFSQLGFYALLSLFIFFIVNAQVKRYETRLERISSQRKQLIHVLSHDLANPIGAIKNVCELSAEEGENGNEAKEYHKMVQESVEQSIGMLNLVRQIEALETGKMRLELQEVNMRESIETSYTMLKDRFREKGIVLENNVSEDIVVRAEPYSLCNSVLNNLLSNAVKFSPRNGHITINGVRRGRWAEITVIDRGIGIPGETLGRLFDLTSATSRPGTEGEEGTGFGMPLVKSFIENYGGKIEVESREKAEEAGNHGTTIRIRLDCV